jgi:hypothetical protein
MMTGKLIGPTLLIVLLSKGAWGQIYKTTDEEGNTVFTDIPPSEKSEVVDLPAANIADSVEPAPRPAPQPETRKSPSGPESDEVDPQPGDNVTIIGDTHNDRLEEQLAREKRHDVLQAKPPREVLEGERPKEIIDADPPRDVRKADHLEHRAPPVHRAKPRR